MHHVIGTRGSAWRRGKGGTKRSTKGSTRGGNKRIVLRDLRLLMGERHGTSYHEYGRMVSVLGTSIRNIVVMAYRFSRPSSRSNKCRRQVWGKQFGFLLRMRTRPRNKCARGCTSVGKVFGGEGRKAPPSKLLFLIGKAKKTTQRVLFPPYER